VPRLTGRVAAAAIVVAGSVAVIAVAVHEREEQGTTGSGQTATARRPPSGSTGLRLLVADTPAPFVADLDRANVGQITGLPTSGERGVTVLPVGRDALVLSNRYCDGCRPDASVYLVRRGSTVATPLGRALEALPSRDGEGVWMLNRDTRRCAISELDLDGRRRRAARRVRCGTGLVAELPAGLLLSYTGALGSDAHNELLELDDGVVRLPYQDAQPVVGNLVLTGTDRRTPLVLHDVTSGASQKLSWPSRLVGLGVVTGQPNGRLATVDFARYSPTHRFDLWLLDTGTGRWQHMPGMPAHLIPKATDVEWTADGRILILSGGFLRAWRPGESRVTVHRVKPPRQPGMKFLTW
jgi:hypothetical protein